MSGDKPVELVPMDAVFSDEDSVAVFAMFPLKLRIALSAVWAFGNTEDIDDASTALANIAAKAMKRKA